MLEAERISEARSINTGPTHTELSVTLSYLPKRINNNRTTLKEMSYFFRTLRNPE